MIEVRDLRKSFGTVKALEGVSFDISPGEIFGLLGPNGAGKTTTLSILCGLVEPDSGTVTGVLKRDLGLATQEIALYDDLSGHDNLRFFGSLYGLSGQGLASRMTEVLRFVGLEDRARSRVRTYSGGMKRRLNLAAGLLHDPPVLLLDEPTVGVDPQSRNFIFENIGELKRRGKTIVYTTHYMEEAERLCDRVAIIDHGKIIALDTVRGLLERAGNVYIIRATLSELPADLEPIKSRGIKAELHGSTLIVETSSPETLTLELLRTLKTENLQISRPSLEAVFLHLTGRELRDE